MSLAHPNSADQAGTGRLGSDALVARAAVLQAQTPMTEQTAAAWSVLRLEAAEAGNDLVVAQACAALAPFLAKSGRGAESLSLVTEGLARADRLPLSQAQALLTVLAIARVRALIVLHRSEEAIQLARGVLADPHFVEVALDLRVTLLTDLAVLFSTVDGWPSVAQLLDAMQMLLDTSADVPLAARAAWPQLTVSLLGLVSVLPAFELRANPNLARGAWQSSLAYHLRRALVLLENEPEHLARFYGAHQVEVLASARRIAKALGVALPRQRAPAAVIAGPVHEPSLRDRWVTTHWASVADLLDDQPRLVIERVRAQMGASSVDDTELVESLYVLYRAYSMTQQLLPALQCYERHVAASARIRAFRRPPDDPPMLTGVGWGAAEPESEAWPPELRLAVQHAWRRSGVGVTVADLAVVTHRSERWVREAFTQHLGLPPKEYLDQLRLQGARRQIESGWLPGGSIARFAARWGFSHAGRFSAAFRKAFGKDPLTAARAHAGLADCSPDFKAG